jgi:hypothetical protein
MMAPPEMAHDAPFPDPWIDAALRAVEVPPQLGDRLRPEQLFDERAIDRMLVDVSMPVGLAARVRVREAVAPARAVGGPVDTKLRGWGARWLRELARDGMAVAAALGFVIAMFCAGVSITDFATRGPRERPQARHAATRGTRPVDGVDVESGAGGAVATGAATDRPLDGVADRPAAEPRSNAVVATNPAPAAGLPAVRGAPLPVGPALDRSRPSGGMQVVPDDATAHARRSVPRMRGFDLAFEMAHGEPPFVDPAIAPGLAVDRPPLGVATDSFDRAWPLPPGRQRLAAVGRLRAEHLVAALSSGAASRRDDSLALRLSAVRSFRSGRPTYLVEVCVAGPVAGSAAAAPRDPAEVTVVLDHSAGPDAVPLWLAACRGLAAAAARMGLADRVSVIVAEPRPRRVAIRATPAEIGDVCRELEEELPFGNADLDAAVALAEESAMGDEATQRLVVVAEADRAERCDGAAGDALHRYRAAVARGTEDAASRCQFLLVSGVSDGTDSDGLSAVPGWTLTDPTTVRRRLDAVLVDVPPFVAESVALELRFDPRVIAAYRLVGYRQSVPESLAAFGKAASVGGLPALHGGEAMRVVYEVVPRSDPLEQVAGVAATLSYREPSGAVRTHTASGAEVDRFTDMLPSPQGCELLLAVGIGECADRSVHAVTPRLAIEQLRALSAAWRQRGDVTVVGARLIGILEDVASGGRGSAQR